jgi:hypothetical protein
MDGPDEIDWPQGVTGSIGVVTSNTATYACWDIS